MPSRLILADIKETVSGGNVSLATKTLTVWDEAMSDHLLGNRSAEDCVREVTALKDERPSRENNTR